MVEGDQQAKDSKSGTDPVKHVVMLILENHSFDQMLGCFKEIYPELDGVDPQAPATNRDSDDKVYAQQPLTERQMLLDPHHEVEHVAVQMQDGNRGFVRDFSASFPASPAFARDCIMGYYPRGFLPGLHTLAGAFTICDRWHSSLPGPTWPNRFFALSGTSLGRVNMPGDGTHKSDLAGYFQQDQETIFDRLNDRGIDWKVYFHDIPQTSVFTRQRLPHNAARYFYIRDFFADARGAAEDFPQFSLIEPGYMGWEQNDDHPPHDVMRGEKLIADVYNALRGNEALWASTLLVVFYDEHGGFYDHVPPPSAPPPDGHREEYSFERLGLRVPALLVSPYAPRGVSKTLFDHTSVLKYLIEKWDLAPLGARTAAANSIGTVLACDARTDTPEQIILTPGQLRPPDPDAEEKAFDMPNAHQTALALFTTYLRNDMFRDLPVIYALAARFLEGVRKACHHAVLWLGGGAGVSISTAEPAKLAHHLDAVPRDDFVRFLMLRKAQGPGVLAGHLRDDSRSPSQKAQAVRTLSLISGRGYSHEPEGLKNADSWLRRHNK